MTLISTMLYCLSIGDVIRLKANKMTQHYSIVKDSNADLTVGNRGAICGKTGKT